ncbi:MAG: hypothetical protein Q8R61_13075 [Thiobacillus sp.]|uniref:hypothetical protein n=1 Tax=Thiobacillus sp. TaxID=924 RepID=UPI0027360B81|nr:hypothetical protein [Thiobacillus sp.]MDP3586056.1 hypothetical protein [Thiobacillus sp.]
MISYSRYRSHGAALTKQYFLDDDGQLGKTTKAQMVSGIVETRTAANLAEFVAGLDSLSGQQAVGYGICGRDRARLVRQRDLSINSDAIARAKEYFRWPDGPAILMLDYDPRTGAAPLSPEQLRSALLVAVHELTGAPMAWRPSSSSYIYDAETGNERRGLRGQRLYIAVAKGSDIPRAGRLIFERLWLSGYGYFAVSKAGSLLERCLFDAAVWSPERLDFAAGAHCQGSLVQRWPAPLLFNLDAPPFDVASLPDLTAVEGEKLWELKSEARNDAKPEQQRVRDAYIATRSAELVTERGMSLDAAQAAVRRAVESSLLFPDFDLVSESGKTVTVGEVLTNPVKWHGARFADPVEPDYRNDRRVAWVNLLSGGRPYLYSHAHGGRRFELISQPSALTVQPGALSALADSVLDVLRLRGGLYEQGRLVRVAEDGRIYVVSPQWLEDWIGRCIRFEVYDRDKERPKPVGVPHKLANIITERHGERRFPRLHGVVTAPTLRHDGSVLDRPGYDEGTGLLYICNQPEHIRIPTKPTPPELARALANLWHPFAAFPLDGAVSRGVLLAGLLTAVVRRTLPTAPGFAFDAPTAGSGKTKLAVCLSLLAGGDGTVHAPANSDEEARKALFSCLRGGEPVIIWDNVTGHLDGAALNAFLTSPVFSDRVLGISSIEALPNTALFAVSGNNLTIAGDAARRVLVCRIDSQTENPHLRSFGFDPVESTRANRQEMVAAALTLLRGYLAAGAPALAEGSVGSFEAWGSLVRNAVLWIGSQDWGLEVGDPVRSIERNRRADPVKETLSEMLHAWEATFGSSVVLASDAIKAGAAMGSPLCEAFDGLKSDWGGREPFTARRLGKYLSRHTGHIVDGLYFHSEPGRSRQTFWRVLSTSNPDPRGL